MTNKKSNAIIQTYIVVVLYKSKTPKIAFAVESGPQRLFFFYLYGFYYLFYNTNYNNIIKLGIRERQCRIVRIE